MFSPLCHAVVPLHKAAWPSATLSQRSAKVSNSSMVVREQWSGGVTNIYNSGGAEGNSEIGIVRKITEL